jgi:hypothetical protein
MSQAQNDIFLTTSMIKTKNHGDQQEYNWKDDAGYHQYYCPSDIQPILQSITDFKYTIKNNYRTYSWNDNLGFHQYYCNDEECWYGKN